jgi:deazaflavin-dependent oxidoreductase (nitroreductase family)
MLLLDHVGAKSGMRRTTPLTYLREGEKLVIVASKGGHPKNPWLRRSPRALRPLSESTSSRRPSRL